MNKLRTRVISQEKGMYKISSGTEIKTATLSGKYRYDVKTVSDYPAVGDYGRRTTMRRTTADTLKPKGRNLRKLQKSTNRSEKIGADRQNKIIPLTRKLQPLTRNGKQLTRKAGVNFYGFIF